MIANTAPSQDREIAAAQTSPHIDNLVAIIESLDEKLTEWKNAARKLGCDTPDGLAEEADRIMAELAELAELAKEATR